MKVKPYQIGGATNSSVIGTSSNPWAASNSAATVTSTGGNGSGSTSVLNNMESMDDAHSQSPTVLTRFRAAKSAAAAAAAHQAAVSNSSHSVNKSFSGTTATTRPTTSSSSSLGVVVNGHKSQHHIGKIVKPIPVRPMSSSASSTHSSSYHHHHHHHHHSHHQNQQQLVNFISNSLTSINNSTGVPTANPDANEFSLIAKYFASFPATRLKTNTTNTNVESDSPSTSSLLHNHQSNQSSSNASISPILNQNTTNSKRTPFLPFKKSSISTASTTNMPSNVGSHSNQHHQQDLARVSGLVTTPSSLVPIDLGKSTSEHHPYNLRHHAQPHQQHQSTDHLCSNFRRMIKLNESHILAHNEDSNNLNPSSPYTAASNTPTGCLLDSNNDSNDSFTHNFNQTAPAGSVHFLHAGSNNDSLIMPPPSITDRLVSTPASHQASSSSRFAQITMETRLTRKFLIKHHPYLQYHGGYNGSTSMSDNKHQQSTQQQQPPRPSINLIKMKKLANKRLARQQETGMNNTTANTSCNNNDHDDCFFSNSDPTPQKLLKFTDMAPSPGIAANNSIISSLRSTKQRSIKQQASKTNIRTRRNSSMIETEWVNDSVDKTAECINNPEVNLTTTSFTTTVLSNNSSNNNPSLTNCGASSIVNSNNEFDDSKEDSSGYYSSYHSTDLISSSGGSVVGVGDHGVLLLGKHNIEQQPSSATNLKTTTNTVNSTSTNQTSHHHYHTRYSNNNSASSTATQLHTKKMSSTPPTTRLRYHQQQLATNNDLDLDQIEND